jgi:cytochrome P450/NADPH-cytochrome P450 reductase
LAFAVYCLMNHPQALCKARQEADEGIAAEAPTFEEVTQLHYIRMVLSESLRLYPTAPGFSLYAKEDTVIGGKYPLHHGEQLSIIVPALHRDRRAWGEDADAFRPERFADPTKIPAGAYKPFGTGQRSCIGRQFALHEAAMVVGMILKHFDLIPNGDYTLKVKQTLTLKPHHFTIRPKPRTDVV